MTDTNSTTLEIGSKGNEFFPSLLCLFSPLGGTFPNEINIEQHRMHKSLFTCKFWSFCRSRSYPALHTGYQTQEKYIRCYELIISVGNREIRVPAYIISVTVTLDARTQMAHTHHEQRTLGSSSSFKIEIMNSNW